MPASPDEFLPDANNPSAEWTKEANVAVSCDNDACAWAWAAQSEDEGPQIAIPRFRDSFLDCGRTPQSFRNFMG
jgi:hypothetical protein